MHYRNLQAEAAKIDVILRFNVGFKEQKEGLEASPQISAVV